MSRLSACALAVAALMTPALVLAGCGLPVDSAAREVPPSLVPSVSPSASVTASPTQTPTPSASESHVPRLRLWFVTQDGLAAVESELPTGAAPDAVLAALTAGPSGGDGSLRTIARDPITGASLVSVNDTVPTDAATTDGATSVIAVRLSPEFSALPSAEQVLLLGQVVLSLTGAGYDAVMFTDDAGTLLAVPLPDGLLLAEPATARDYNSLIINP